MHPLIALIPKITQSWCRETAQNPETWAPHCPEKDQCAVTAALILARTGLPIVRGQAFLPDGRIDSHYWNEGLNLTFSQYPAGTERRVRKGVQGETAYTYLLSSIDLAHRLALLEARVDATRP